MIRSKMGNSSLVALCMVFAMSFAIHFYVATASDAAPLQDFCVGVVDDPRSPVFVNGLPCKNPKHVTPKDFVYKGFNIPGDVNDNVQGFEANLVDAFRFPALNTLGVAMARIDFGPFGLNTLHLHPRASQILTVVKGTLYAGFITTEDKLYDAVLEEGDMIVFPQGLVHFQLNLGETCALAIASFGSQHPGRVNVADAVFGTWPRIRDDVLTKAYQVDEIVIDKLRSQFLDYYHKSVNKTGRSIPTIRKFLPETNNTSGY